MTPIENIINGVYQAIGFMIITTIFSILSWFFLKKFIAKQGAELWRRIKEEVTGLDVKVEIDRKKKKK
jgi:hypothetical protein